MTEQKPVLSFVCVSRNDNHGGLPNDRLAYICRNFVHQCEKFKVSGEYIIVEWNPPADRPRLREVLRLQSSKHCKVRIITVPPEIHRKHRFADKLPLFQMIGKNVGIRRASGEFVLSSNIDILLSTNLFIEITKKKLRKDVIYRSSRFDVASDILSEDFSETLAYRLATRLNLPSGTLQLGSGGEILKTFGRSHVTVNQALSALAFHKVAMAIKRKISKNSKNRFRLHTNACGDFQLLHRDSWHRLRGFSEMEIYSFHLDSLFMFSALQKGIYSVAFPPPYYHFHVDHADGWTPEAPEALFDRLKQNGIGYIDQEISIFEELHRRNEIYDEPLSFHWGLGLKNLEDTYL